MNPIIFSSAHVYTSNPHQLKKTHILFFFARNPTFIQKQPCFTFFFWSKNTLFYFCDKEKPHITTKSVIAFTHAKNFNTNAFLKSISEIFK